MDIANLYGQFCPVSMASEVICTRWTPLVLRELMCGSTRFSDLRRGVPRMSPTLLSKRLKELELAGVIRVERGAAGPEYRLTEAGEELRPLILGLGRWGQRWVESRLSLRNLDPSLLMWDIRRNVRPEPAPAARTTIEFIFGDRAPPQRNYWLVVEPAHEADLCTVDPGYDVDLYVSTDLRTLTELWLGYSDWPRALHSGALRLTGTPERAAQLRAWLPGSAFAAVAKQAA